jgi:tetraacyldisaccharide 4'-kinase
MTLLDDLWSDPSPRGPLAALIHPLLRGLEVPFRAGVSWRDALYRHGWKRAERAPLPVISIGGIEVGGVGKTPLVLELLRLACREGFAPAVLSRGYGARERIARRVPDAGDPLLYGDEPLWLARDGSGAVWVARRRIEAARAAFAEGASIALLDDGLQHRSLFRDAEVVTLAGAHPLGNGRLLPAGSLREPPEKALARADRIVLSDLDAGEAARSADLVRPFLRAGTPILSWRGLPGLRSICGTPPQAGEAVRLLAGIAHPERLVISLRALGIPVSERRFLPDHHAYRFPEVRRWIEQAAMLPVITTEKDWIRLCPLLEAHPAEAAGARISILTQRLEWNEPDAEAEWSSWLRQVTQRRR